MKPVLTTLLILAALLGSAQEPLAFSGVIKTDSTATKDQIMLAVKSWYLTALSSKSLPVSDNETGIIVTRVSMPYTSDIFMGNNATRGTISYDLQVTCKDGRYKYELTNFRHEGTGGAGQFGSYPALSFGLLTTEADCPANVIPNEAVKWRNNLWHEMKDRAKHESQVAELSLSKYVDKFLQKKAKDDW